MGPFDLVGNFIGRPIRKLRLLYRLGPRRLSRAVRQIVTSVLPILPTMLCVIM